MSNILDANEVWLRDQCQGQPWFYDLGKDQYGRYVVYATYMDRSVVAPDRTPDGKQVLVHFAAHLQANEGRYVNHLSELVSFATQSILKQSNTSLAVVGPSPEPTVGSSPQEEMLQPFGLDEEIGSEEEEKSILYLQRELDRLEKQCGSYTLQDVFYEAHDQKNAVTNLSDRYPEVRKGMERLYKLYGFNAIYDELDG